MNGLENTVETRAGGSRRRAGGLALLLVLLGGSLAGCHADAPSAAADVSAEQEPVVVTVATAVRRAVQRRIEAVGTLHGFEEVVISAAVGGRVQRIEHDVADRVEPGALLLTIDPTDYELAMRQAERGLQVELARLGLQSPPSQEFDLTQLPSVMQAKLRLDQARQRYERGTGLAGRNAIPAETLEDQRTAFHLAEAEYQNQLNQVRSDLATIQLREESWAIAKQQWLDTKVTVPVPQVLVPTARAAEGSTATPKPIQVAYAITSRSAAEGAQVRAGEELFRLVIEDPLKLRVKVAEIFVPEVAEDQEVAITIAAYEMPFQGRVRRINPAVDPVSRTFEVEIHVPNPERWLKPGGFAKADILTRVDTRAMTVPLEAVVSFAGIDKVFVVDSEQRALPYTVKLGVQGTDWVELQEAPLPEDAQVVITGQAALVQGTPVRIRSASPSATTDEDGAAEAAGKAAASDAAPTTDQATDATTSEPAR